MSHRYYGQENRLAGDLGIGARGVDGMCPKFCIRCEHSYWKYTEAILKATQLRASCVACVVSGVKWPYVHVVCSFRGGKMTARPTSMDKYLYSLSAPFCSNACAKNVTLPWSAHRRAPSVVTGCHVAQVLCSILPGKLTDSSFICAVPKVFCRTHHPESYQL
ncbi:hypothetical protein E2C01_078849 [Portunus trituberculatus]|uniref:Uncharacterized protein n=1 Tax=Portunus trituberculatus TaxID=210409 RepID=A0A5B7IJY1_PORTR|nr:hypothetical protein [Portunus trituberculatus]